MNALRQRIRCRLRRGAFGRLAERRQRGAALIELAVFLPLILVFGLACMQFAVVFIAYMNVVQITRDATRWVAVHPNVVDGAADGSTSGSTTALIKGRLPAGITSSALTLAYTPACTALSGGKCTARPAGTTISVRSTYDISSLLFVPTTLGWGTLSVAIPTTLPSYEVFMQVEPS